MSSERTGLLYLCLAIPYPPPNAFYRLHSARLTVLPAVRLLPSKAPAATDVILVDGVGASVPAFDATPIAKRTPVGDRNDSHSASDDDDLPAFTAVAAPEPTADLVAADADRSFHAQQAADALVSEDEPLLDGPATDAPIPVDDAVEDVEEPDLTFATAIADTTAVAANTTVDSVVEEPCVPESPETAPAVQSEEERDDQQPVESKADVTEAVHVANTTIEIVAEVVDELVSEAVAVAFAEALDEVAEPKTVGSSGAATPNDAPSQASGEAAEHTDALADIPVAVDKPAQSEQAADVVEEHINDDDAAPAHEDTSLTAPNEQDDQVAVIEAAPEDLSVKDVEPEPEPETFDVNNAIDVTESTDLLVDESQVSLASAVVGDASIEFDLVSESASVVSESGGPARRTRSRAHIRSRMATLSSKKAGTVTRMPYRDSTPTILLRMLTLYPTVRLGHGGRGGRQGRPLPRPRRPDRPSAWLRLTTPNTSRTWPPSPPRSTR